MVKSARKIKNKLKKRGSIKRHKVDTLYIDSMENLGKLFVVLIALVFFYFPIIGVSPPFLPVIKVQDAHAEDPKEILYSAPEVPNEGRRRVTNDKQPEKFTEEIKGKICLKFGKYCREALIISLYESRWYTLARSSADARGIFQIHCPAHKKKVGGDCNKLYDVDTNIDIAYNMFVASGYHWYPWDVKDVLKREEYRAFLNGK